MAYPTFRQLATLLGGKYSASSMAAAEGIHWPPPPSISLRAMLSFRPKVISVAPPPEPGQPRTTSSGYFDAPPELLDPNAGPMDCKALTTDGRVTSDLRVAAQHRDGNAILNRVAGRVAENFKAPGSFSQDLITAMTQLAVTGSNAFAAWSANPTHDLTPYLIQEGMPPAAAGTASQQIMSDFNAARQAVRNPGAGMNESALRQGLKYSWIAVSGEDDPPDYPVNVGIAKYPQYHLSVIVPTPAGANSSIELSIRYIIASSQGTTAVPENPYIPPGNEVVLYIHGEGSRAEEAADFIPALFSVGRAAGRSFTVVAFDQPDCGYSTMVPHLSVAPMPSSSGVGGVLDTSSFSGSPILDFVENAIVVFVEELLLPYGNPITAIVGGSLGGHMALRLAASQKDWVKNVIAWSPASVMDHDFLLGFTVFGNPLGATLSQRLLTDPVLAGRATDGPSPAWPASSEQQNSRSDFFNTVWCKNTVDPTDFDVAAVAAALISQGIFVGPLAPIAGLGAGVVTAAILSLPTVPPQPQLWYRGDWASKPTYIEESRRDRREVYNTNFRQWHWRICEEMISFKFDALAPSMNKPLLLMVGEKDDYPEVHFLLNVTNFAAALTGPAQGGLTIQDTGHSIHNERPFFLAHQVVNFTSPP
jgi:pimeloyl-ACP methyl ester carboxylesterase